MKVFIVLCLVAAVAFAQVAKLTPEQSQKLREHHKKCLDESHANPDLITKLRNGQLTDDKNLDAYGKCLFEQIGFMNAAGEIQLDVLKAKGAAAGLTEEELKKLQDDCGSGVRSQPIEKKATFAYDCFYHKSNGKLQIVPEVA